MGSSHSNDIIIGYHKSRRNNMPLVIALVPMVRDFFPDARCRAMQKLHQIYSETPMFGLKSNRYDLDTYYAENVIAAQKASEEGKFPIPVVVLSLEFVSPMAPEWRVEGKFSCVKFRDELTSYTLGIFLREAKQQRAMGIVRLACELYTKSWRSDTPVVWPPEVRLTTKFRNKRMEGLLQKEFQQLSEEELRAIDAQVSRIAEEPSAQFTVADAAVIQAKCEEWAGDQKSMNTSALRYQESVVSHQRAVDAECGRPLTTPVLEDRTGGMPPLPMMEWQALLCHFLEVPYHVAQRLRFHYSSFFMPTSEVKAQPLPERLQFPDYDFLMRSGTRKKVENGGDGK